MFKIGSLETAAQGSLFTLPLAHLLLVVPLKDADNPAADYQLALMGRPIIQPFSSCLRYVPNCCRGRSVFLRAQ